MPLQNRQTIGFEKMFRFSVKWSGRALRQLSAPTPKALLLHVEPSLTANHPGA
jgi:hypothetical protein